MHHEPIHRGCRRIRPTPLPLIDRRVVVGRQAADVDNSWITQLGVSTMALAKRCRRFSRAGLESALLLSRWSSPWAGCLGLVAAAVLGPHKNQAKLADLNFVTTNQHSR